MACYANKELHDIMTTASAAVSACANNPGQYPNGKTAGASFCMFDSLGFVSFCVFNYSRSLHSAVFGQVWFFQKLF